jgi:uncharacterized membrane protein YeaQ/YmgE (transglycosylase-associated protein family)
MDWLYDIIKFGLIGLGAGWLASYLLNSRGSPIYYMLVGMVGAIVGGVIFGLLQSLIAIGSNLLTATIGALIVIIGLRYWQGQQLIKK